MLSEGTFAVSATPLSVEKKVALLQADEDNQREDDVQYEEGTVKGGHCVNRSYEGGHIEEAKKKVENSINQSRIVTAKNLLPMVNQKEKVVYQEVDVEKSWSLMLKKVYFLNTNVFCNLQIKALT